CTSRLAYQQVERYDRLEPVFGRARAIEGDLQLSGNRIYYLALPPATFASVLTHLGEHRHEQRADCWTRVLIEKPFVSDLESSIELYRDIDELFSNREIYRIDQYFGK